MEIRKKDLIIPLLAVVLLSFVSSAALAGGSSAFSATFESPNNNFSQFDETSGSACSIQNTIVYSGSYSAKLAIRGDSQYFLKNVPSTTTMSVQFSFYVEDAQLTQYDPMVFLTVYDSTSKRYSVMINMEEAVPHWKVIDGLTGSSYTNTTAIVKLNSWNAVVFTVTKSDQANSEILQFYTDGDLICRLTGTGNGNGLTQVRFMGEQVSNIANLYFDSIYIDNEIIVPPFPTPIPTFVPTPSPSPTLAPTSSPSPSPTQSPTPTPTPVPTPTATPVPTPSPTQISTPTPSPSPTITPSNTPAPSSSPIVSVAPTPTPVSVATPTASPSPSPILTSAPTLASPIVSPIASSTPIVSSAPSPKSTSTPPIQDSEITKSSELFSYAIAAILIAVIVSLTTFAYFLTKRRKTIKKRKFDNHQIGEAISKIPIGSSEANEAQTSAIASFEKSQYSGPPEDGETEEQVASSEPEEPELKRVELTDESMADKSKQAVLQTNSCPKNLDYFMLKPRPKQMPEECLTCSNLLKCVCLTEK